MEKLALARIARKKGRGQLLALSDILKVLMESVGGRLRYQSHNKKVGNLI